MLRKPDWIRVKAPGSPIYKETQQIVRENNLVTVCEEAGCPNIGECWSKKHATMMIMGEICTRACAFCNVRTGLPTALDPMEPENVANAVDKLGLAHVVITSVDRDDLPDGGAEHFAQVIRAIRAAHPKTTIEILTPDFLRKEGALEIVVAAKPDVFNYNLETVPVQVPQGPSRRPLLPLHPPAAAGQGARPHHVHQVRHHGRPRRGAERGPATDGRPALGRRRFPHHRPVPAADQEAPPGRSASCTPDEFKSYATVAKTKGFLLVSSSPLTRSSHHAGEDFAAAQGDPAGQARPCLISSSSVTSPHLPRAHVRPGQ